VPRKSKAPSAPRGANGNAVPPAPGPDPHVARALEYCRKVTSGALPACKYVRQACQRQLDDLVRAEKDPAWPYRFDEGKAGRACRFLEQLPHVKGPKRGELFKLELWQCFIVTTVFGWVKRENGRRRFRRAYIEVPRGNGKSFMSSGIGLYGLCADGEGGSDIYSAATTTEQANITRGDADAMLSARPALGAKLGLKRTAHAIFQPSTNSTFKALSRESKNHEGKNVHFGLIDELHAHPSREVWDVVIMGSAKRTQSLIWAITTAGVDMAGICYEVRDGVVKVLDGAPNEQLFGIIYTIDEGDDWRSETAWVKANPNWHASIDIDVFKMDATEAMQTASKENNFKTKHLNIWCNADVAWMQMSAWDACSDRMLTSADFSGDPCIVALDLASKIDVAAKATLFYRDLPTGEPGVNHGPLVVAGEAEGEVPELAPPAPPKFERHFYLFMEFFLPEAAVAKSTNAQLDGWVKEGRVQTTPGDVLDFDAVRNALRRDMAALNVRECAYDPWQAQDLANQMQAEGLTMVEMRPTVQNFSAPMKELEALVLQRRLHHDGNPAMRWMISNVVAHRDAKENIYPRKEKPENKIDGPVTAIMAVGRALLAPPSANDVYADRGFLTL
jgi:phage terminase large subunit-like protein